MNAVITIAAGYKYRQIRQFFVSAAHAKLDATIYVIRSIWDEDIEEDVRNDCPKTVIVRPFQMILSKWIVSSARVAQLLSYLSAKLLQALKRDREGFGMLGLAVLLQHPAVARYYHAWRIIHEHPEIRYVMLSDIRDVVFQTDPFERLDEALYTGFEGKLMKDEPLNTSWVHELTDDLDVLLRVKDRQISCSGVTLGARNEILSYLETFLRLLTAKCHRVRSKAGIDQAMHNLVILDWPATLPLREERLGSSLIMTVNNEWEKYWRLETERGVVVDATPVSIIHQFDRKHALINYLTEKYGMAMPVNRYAS